MSVIMSSYRSTSCIGAGTRASISRHRSASCLKASTFADATTISTDVCANATASPSDEGAVNVGRINLVTIIMSLRRLPPSVYYHKNAIYGQGGIWFDSVDDSLNEGQLNGVAGGIRTTPYLS